MAKTNKPKPSPTNDPMPARIPVGFIRGTAHAQRAGRKGGNTPRKPRNNG